MKLIQLFFTVVLCFIISCTNTPTETTSLDATDTTEKKVTASPVEAVKPQPVAETTSSASTEATAEQLALDEKKRDQEEAEAKQKAKEEAAAKKRREKRRKARKEKERKAAEKSKITFKEPIYDFGVIAQGDKIQHDFVFENTGNADVEILNVDVTCGCTVPTFPFLPIAPGEKGTIGVTYNSTGKLGNQKPMITIITNAKPPTYKIYLKGVVDAERAKTEN